MGRFWQYMRQKIFFQAGLPRTIGETLLLGTITWAVVISVIVLRGHNLLNNPLNAFELYGWLGVLGVGWFSLRLRIPKKLSYQQSGVDLLGAIFVCILLAGIQVPALFFLANGTSDELYGRQSALDETFLFIPVLLFFLNFFTCVTGRVIFRVMVYWNALRRKHLIWQLTHAQMMLYVGGVVLLVFLGATLIASRPDGGTQFYFALAVMTFFFLLFVLAVTLPPTAAISYFAMNKTISRIKNLAEATTALRAGHYQVRVLPQGEDEVAQLQGNFNAMAEALERAMKDLQEERDRVTALLHERRQLIANVSHELRTPVATVRGYIETTLMHKDQLTAEQLEHDFQIMEREVLHLQSRIEELFTLARADLGKLKLHYALTNPADLVRQIVDSRAPLAWRSSRIEVIADLPAKVPLINVDASRVEQAIQNLLHNGLRHTNPGGIIILSVEVLDEHIALSVKDTGEGIPTADLEHIWERFYQVNNAQSRSGGGTGLGLALVKDWVEAMEGTVAVESEIGVGTVFTLTFPKAQEVEEISPTQPLVHYVASPDPRPMADGRTPALQLSKRVQLEHHDTIRS